MGKIRVKTIGAEDTEAEEKKKAKIKREEKKARLSSTESADDRGQAREQSEAAPEEKEQIKKEGSATTEEVKAQTPTQTPEEDKPTEKKTKKEKFAKKEHSRSKIYTVKAMKVDKNKLYSLTEGIELLKSVKSDKFDETVELHINTTESGISGTMTLPHGSGKEIKVAILDDNVLAEVEKGKINFDVLIATPSQMAGLAKVARTLGPRGLMPNPKNGTISEKPEEAAKKFQGGQIGFKTESKLPLIHLSVGKTSFKDSELKENITTAISAVKKNRIKKITLKSTMSPGIRLQL